MLKTNYWVNDLYPIIMAEQSAIYTDGLTEDNWEQVITDCSHSSVWGYMDVVSIAPAPISSWRVQYCMIAHDIASRSKVVVVYCRILYITSCNRCGMVHKK